jgi:hypothetical protein
LLNSTTLRIKQLLKKTLEISKAYPPAATASSKKEPITPSGIRPQPQLDLKQSLMPAQQAEKDKLGELAPHLTQALASTAAEGKKNPLVEKIKENLGKWNISILSTLPGFEDMLGMILEDISDCSNTENIDSILSMLDMADEMRFRINDEWVEEFEKKQEKG